MVRFACPTCNRALQAPEDRAGTVASCPGCGQHITIPAPPAPQHEDIPYAEFRELPPPPPAPQPAYQPSGDRDQDVPEEDFEAPRRRPQKAPNNWNWRWCSPSMMLFSMIMLPLPFVEVSCNVPGGLLSSSIMHQSGIQVMTGDYSMHYTWDQLNQQFAGPQFGVNPARMPDFKVKPAILMIIIPFLLLTGIALGLALRPTALRVPLVAGTVLCALVLLFIQMAVGFPIEREIQAKIREAQEQQNRAPGQVGVGPGNPWPAANNQFARVGNHLAAAMIRTSYTPWFWLFVVVLVGSLGPLVGELVWAANRNSRPRQRWRPAYRDDY
jgi:hypothetical protein